MPQKKITLYNHVLKQFTKINNKLPQERKISLADRRKIIKDVILPQYKDTPVYKVRIKPLKKIIFSEYEKIPPRENCDLNYVDASNYSIVNWFEIDEFLRERLLDCIYVRVNAGNFGKTKIFNTRDYDYHTNGVQKITEDIRPVAYNPKQKIYPFYSGVQKLRPRKKNDGDPESYFLDMILHINEQPLDDDDSVKYELPKTKEVKQQKKKIKNYLDERLKTLKQKKEKKKRARTTLIKNVSLVKQAKKKLKRSATPQASTKLTYLKQFNKTMELLQKQYDLGFITKLRFKQLVTELTNNMKDGGLI